MSDINNKKEKKLLLRKVLLISIFTFVIINIPILILAILSIGGNAIFITLIAITTLTIVQIFYYIILDIIQIYKKKQQMK